MRREPARDPPAVWHQPITQLAGQPHQSVAARRVDQTVIETRSFVKDGESVLEVERGGADVHAHSELRDRGCDAGVDPDDDGVGAAEAPDLGEISERARRERVQHVDLGEIDDDAVGAVSPDLFGEVALEPGELSVVERRVDGRDQVIPLPQDGDPRRPRRLLVPVVRHRSSRCWVAAPGARYHPRGKVVPGRLIGVAPAVPGNPGSSVRVLLGAAIVGGALLIFDAVTGTATGVVAGVAALVLLVLPWARPAVRSLGPAARPHPCSDP